MLLFDEPTAGLDPDQLAAGRRAHRPGAAGVCDTAIVVTHDVELAQDGRRPRGRPHPGAVRGARPRDDVLESTNPAVQAFLAGEAR